MYYEEKIIYGALHYRNTPDGKWYRKCNGGKHTPQWYAEETGCGGQGLIIDEADGRNVAVCYDSKDGPLLAAAPEMEEALKSFVALWPVLPGNDTPKATPEVIHAWREARAILAKLEE